MIFPQLHGVLGAEAAAAAALCLPSDPGTDRRTAPYVTVTSHPTCGTRIVFAPHVVSAQLLAAGANACAPSQGAPGGRDPGTGRLICVRCAPGYAPQEGVGCVPYVEPKTNVTPDQRLWREIPLPYSMRQIPLPASFYALGRLVPGSLASLRADGTYVVVADHRGEAPMNDPINRVLHSSDREAYEAHRGDEKLNLKTGKVMSVIAGELPFMTWNDPVTGVPVGAFFKEAAARAAQTGYLSIRSWDPYTLKDLWNDIKGKVCPTVQSQNFMAAATAAAAVVGYSMPELNFILPAARLLCGPAPAPTPTPDATEETIMYPQGTIHTNYSGEYYIAVPVGTATAAGGLIEVDGRLVPMIRKPSRPSTGPMMGLDGSIVLLGPATHTVVANTEPSVDPATKGSTPVTPAQFEEMTGKKLAVHRNWWFWAAIGGGVAALGGGVFFISRHRANKTRRTRSR